MPGFSDKHPPLGIDVELEEWKATKICSDLLDD